MGQRSAGSESCSERLRRLAWVTDIHLNFLKQRDVQAFCERISDAQPDALLVGGDIAEAPTLEAYLTTLENELTCPIYFVLGNHDFYRGSIAAVRADMAMLTRRSRRLTWLSVAGVVPLSETTALIGHDGWADGRLGNYDRSSVMLNDYVLIDELANMGKETRLRRLIDLGVEAADHVAKVLGEALGRFQDVVLLTLVPPFKESCWHEGRISDDNWLPHFTCRAVGEVLVEQMQRHPEQRLTVLCGHTHGAGVAQVLPNLLVKTGGATYGRPELQEVLEVR